MISDFITAVKTRGLARTNRYVVEIPFPNTGQFPIDGTTARLTNLFCESVQIPGVNIATQPARIFGEQRDMPYERTFDPLTTTFYIDSDMLVKTAFDRWAALVVHPIKRTMGYHKDYKRDILIHVETVAGQRPMTIKVFEAYPKQIGSIQLETGGRDVMKLQVTWAYWYWASEIKALPGTIGNNDPRNEVDPEGIVAGAGELISFDNASDDEVDDFGFKIGPRG